MSELTQCNHCSLRQLKAEARKKKQVITMRPGRTFGIKHSEGGGIRGIDVFMHPRSVKIDELRPDQREKYWARWFWELSDHCVC